MWGDRYFKRNGDRSGVELIGIVLSTTKNGPAKRSRNRQMEREMRFELTTSTLAIFA